ncbi:hypothetical protein AeRB84_013455 [Aphanomyces euteiches]|nr:hypothetical protein AeRB84_013455 [Aphanomyces euteiches]
MSQDKFIDELLVNFHMHGCDTAPTPQVQGLPADAVPNENHANVPYRSLTGALQYLVTATRPDIAFAVRFLSSHKHDYNIGHWKMAKRALKYLQGTKVNGILYNGNLNATPQALSDADLPTTNRTASLTRLSHNDGRRSCDVDVKETKPRGAEHYRGRIHRCSRDGKESGVAVRVASGDEDRGQLTDRDASGQSKCNASGKSHSKSQPNKAHKVAISLPERLG